MAFTHMTLETHKMILIGALTLFAIVILVWANWPPRPSKQETFSHRPYQTTVNKWCRHDFYRKVSLSQIVSHWGEKSLDYVFYVEDSTADQTFAIVQVFNWIGQVRLRTVFRFDDGSDVQMDWQPAKGRLFGVATGLFVIPQSAVSAKTEVLN